MTVLNLPDSLIAQLQDAPVLPASEKIKVLITHIDTGMTFSLSIGPGETIVRIHEWMHAFIDETSFLEWTVDRGIETMGLSDAEDDDSVLHVTGRVVYSDPLVDDQTPWLPCIKRNSRSSYGEKYVKKLKEAMHQGHQLIQSGVCLQIPWTSKGSCLTFQIVSISRLNEDRVNPINDWVRLPQKKEAVVWTIDPPLIYSLRLKPQYYGYTDTLKELSFYIDSHLVNRASFESAGVTPIPSVLVTGPPGVGKSCLIRAAMNRHRVPAIPLNLLRVAQWLDRGQEDKAESIIINAKQKSVSMAPSILIIDNLDVVSTDFSTQFEPSALTNLLKKHILDISSDHPVFVIGEIQDVKMLPPVLVTDWNEATLFSRVMSMDVPNQEQRKELVRGILSDQGEALDDVTEEASLVMSTVGYTARDIYSLLHRARRPPLFSDPKPAPYELPDLSSLSISKSLNLQKAILSNPWQSTGSHHFTTTKPTHVSWSDVGGYASLKDRLKRLVNGSFEHRQDFARLGIKPPSGILLYGPSGCGKSHVVSALVSSVPLNFVTAKCHDLFSKYLGESEEYIRSLFKLARRLSPSVLFLDQIEVLGGKREWAETGTTGVNERVLSTLLNEMDGVESSGQVIVVATSNQPWKIDDALLRPGRLDSHLGLALPGHEDRADILMVFLSKGYPLSPSVELNWMASESECFTGSDLVVWLREAAYIAQRQETRPVIVEQKHLQEAIDRCLKMDQFEAEEEEEISGHWRPGMLPETLAQFASFGNRRK